MTETLHWVSDLQTTSGVQTIAYVIVLTAPIYSYGFVTYRHGMIVFHLCCNSKIPMDLLPRISPYFVNKCLRLINVFISIMLDNKSDNDVFICSHVKSEKYV